MRDAFRFSRFEQISPPATHLTVDDEPITAIRGETLAAALLAAGYSTFRTTPVSGAERGPFCLMGACFECLVEIDGVPNRQACMTVVTEGMRVRTMRGARAHGADPITPDAS